MPPFALGGLIGAYRSALREWLRSIIPAQASVLLYARHIERNGKEFYRLTCDLDLEGIVAKTKYGAYGEGMVQDPESTVFAV